MISPQRIVVFQRKILERYGEHKRDLPRRDSDIPYHVLLSEVMLQQTQAERVVPKFHVFLEEASTIEELVNLPKSDLLRLRSGLGFNSRALRLQQCARVLYEEYDGVIPKDRELLRSLPGIGPYTSASILAFAYNIPAPVIDTNIRRVLIHELGVDESLKQQELEEIALLCIPEGKSNDRHNALMDYGSLVATAKATGIRPTSKQSKFEGSKRQVRGNIMKWLVKYGKTEQSTLRKRFSHTDFEQIVAQMITEGLIIELSGYLMIEG